MTIHSISSGDADVSRTHISVFTLPTRTFTGGLRFTWLDYVGEEARRKAASIHSPSASVSYLATEALMRALAEYFGAERTHDYGGSVMSALHER